VGVSGTVWTVDKDGQAAPVAVKLGVNDDKSTELLDASLSEGQQVIVGTVDPKSQPGFLGLRLRF
jgi:multidrug efflux pump subunit AcrA (membrane-fusion protein)